MKTFASASNLSTVEYFARNAGRSVSAVGPRLREILTDKAGPAFDRLPALVKKLASKQWIDALLTSADGLLGDIDPLWNKHAMMAEVVAIHQETPQVKTFILKPSIHWKGFEAGQSLGVGVEIDGVLIRRNYSLSCSPEAFKRTGLVSITVKEERAGRVSGYLHHAVNERDVLRIGPAQGEFCFRSPGPSGQAPSLDGPAPPKSLFIAAGSGITPIMSMLEAIYEHHPWAEMTLVYCVNNAEEVIFSNRLKGMSDRYRDLTFVPLLSEIRGHITREDLSEHVSGVHAKDVYLCGPEGFMQTVLSHLDSLELEPAEVQRESFGFRSPINPAEAEGGGKKAKDRTEQGKAGTVRFERSGKQVDADGQATLLELAEQAGLNPKYGCRSGICHECSCQRGNGELMDIRTGQLINASRAQIQPCISVPLGDLQMPSW